jgi:hypothetical protein
MRCLKELSDAADAWLLKRDALLQPRGKGSVMTKTTPSSTDATGATSPLRGKKRRRTSADDSAAAAVTDADAAAAAATTADTAADANMDVDIDAVAAEAPEGDTTASSDSAATDEAAAGDSDAPHSAGDAAAAAAEPAAAAAEPAQATAAAADAVKSELSGDTPTAATPITTAAASARQQRALVSIEALRELCAAAPTGLQLDELIATNKLLARMEIAQRTVTQALAAAHARGLPVVLPEPLATAKRSSSLGGSISADCDVTSSSAAQDGQDCDMQVEATADSSASAPNGDAHAELNGSDDSSSVAGSDAATATTTVTAAAAKQAPAITEVQLMATLRDWQAAEREGIALSGASQLPVLARSVENWARDVLRVLRIQVRVTANASGNAGRNRWGPLQVDSRGLDVLEAKLIEVSNNAMLHSASILTMNAQWLTSIL